jgi:hypothetical protein
MVAQTNTTEAVFEWLLPAAIVVIVVFAIISVFVMRFIMGRVTAVWMADFPAQPIDPHAEWRSPGHITIDNSTGNGYTLAMDNNYLHLVPRLPMRLFFGMQPRSVPWSAIEVTKIDGDQATALIAGRIFQGPAWAVQRVATKN